MASRTWEAMCFGMMLSKRFSWKKQDRCQPKFFIILLPFYPLSSCQTFLASHFRIDWLSRLGLGKQVGSTTDHLANWYLPSTPKERSTMSAGQVSALVRPYTISRA